jgi:hypothetical protein
MEQFFNCEECGEPLERRGTYLYCPNGCFEDDIRNNYSEDEIEAHGIPLEKYPKDQMEEEEVFIPIEDNDEVWTPSRSLLDYRK